MPVAKKILISKSIRLIPLSEEHKIVFMELANMPQINQRVNKPFPYTEEHFEKYTQNSDTIYVWMIEKAGALCGVINSCALRDPRIFQGGYWIHPEYWGKGAASGAVCLVRDFLFQECAAERIQAVVEPDNPASIRVLEKCGYIREGLLQKFYPSVNRGLIDILMYACIKKS